jgi:hypothetical protein
MEDVKTKPPATVVHLKKNFGDAHCGKCNAILTDDGVYTYSENVYNEPPVGYTNCKAIWAE